MKVQSPEQRKVQGQESCQKSGFLGDGGQRSDDDYGDESARNDGNRMYRSEYLSV